MPTTDWIDRYQERDDNFVVVSYGDLAQVNEAIEPGTFFPDWFADIITISNIRRAARFRAQEQLAGPEIWPDALPWVNDMARYGYDEISHTWDGLTPPPVEGLDVEDDAEDTGLSVGWSRTHLLEGEVGIGTPETVEAQHSFAVTGVWVLGLYANLDPQGGLVAPNPLDDGAPLEANIEWEADRPDLIGLAMTGDETGRAEADTGAMGVHYIIANTDVPSRNLDGDSEPPIYDDWVTGIPTYIPPDPFPTPAPLSGQWNYEDGPPVWTDVWDGTEHGVTGWDNWVPTPHGGEPPASIFVAQDALVVHAALDSYFGASIDLGSESRAARLAVRFQLRAPRFRWTWDGPEPTVTPPRRILGRPHPARIFGDPTVQNGRRALGGIL